MQLYGGPTGTSPLRTWVEASLFEPQAHERPQGAAAKEETSEDSTGASAPDLDHPQEN